MTSAFEGTDVANRPIEALCRHLDRALAPSRAHKSAALGHLREVNANLLALSWTQSAAIGRVARFGRLVASALETSIGTEARALPIDEAASLLGRSQETIRRRIRSGELEALREGRRLLVREDQLWRLTARGLATSPRLQQKGAALRRSAQRRTERATTDVTRRVGQWVATINDEVVVAADTAREVVAWLDAHDRTADSMFRVPVDEQAIEGAAPA
ncbi:MAG: excisionase family DNA-binding protein [Actinobacteria bacterium]|nr:excisionase family DNA-binding protein [Actinomycetota bacterium]